MPFGSAQKRVLVVEDEPTIALGIKLLLSEWGYQVSAVDASGAAALVAATREPPDLLLMDVRLDGRMDGIETAAALRFQHGMPVVFLTAQSDPLTMARLETSAAGGVLFKPVAPERLRHTIAGALAPRRSRNAW